MTQCKSEGVLKLMIDMYSKGARMVDYEQNSPLHWACIWKNFVAAQMLVTVYPEAFSLNNREGRNPIDILGEGQIHSLSDKKKKDVQKSFMKLYLFACVQQYCPKTIHNYRKFEVINFDSSPN